MKWHHVEMGKIANVVSGCGFPREYQGLTDEEFPFFKVGDMNLPGNEKCMTTIANTISGTTLKKLKAKAFPRGTIIFPKIGAAIATNKKRVLTQPSVVDNNVMGLIPKSHINSWYLYYWMLQFDLRSVSNIGPVPSMRKTEVERVSIPLPPLSEQRRIVEILDQADALRKKRAEADAKAARILPALFYKMFGDPATNPKGWEQKPFGDTFDDCTAQFPKLQRNAYLQNGHFPVVDQGKELIAGYTDDESLVTAMGQPVLVFGDHTRIVKFVDFPFVAGADGSRVFMAKKGFAPAFLACQLELHHIPNLGYSRHMRELRRLQFIAPPFKLQQSFANCAMDIRPLLKFQATCCSRIDVLFHCLLHRAFTGDLTAKWREAHMKELLQEMELQANLLNLSRREA
jgi:type I restriction enzyme S subunit